MFDILAIRERDGAFPWASREGLRKTMGHNAAIKRFDAKKSGQPLDIFQSASKLPVVLELLATPWVKRGSQVEAPTRSEVEIPVDWDSEHARPCAFTWKGKRYVVDALVQQWAVDAMWWDRPRARSRRCFRVIARGGVYDLAYDRIGERWLLVGVVD